MLRRQAAEEEASSDEEEDDEMPADFLAMLEAMDYQDLLPRGNQTADIGRQAELKKAVTAFLPHQCPRSSPKSLHSFRSRAG